MNNDQQGSTTLVRTTGVLLALVAAGLAVLIQFNAKIFNDPDTSWHLAAGQFILAAGNVPTTDPFSWSAAGRPWVAHEWLSEVLMALAFRAAGWNGIAILTGAALAFVFTAIALRGAQGLPPQRAVLAVVLVAAAIAPTTLARPHTLAYVLLVGWTLLLIDARRRHVAPAPWIALIMLLWVNMHASWVMGGALAAAFALEALIAGPDRLATLRAWALPGLLCLAATLVNPQGLEAWRYPFAVSGMATLHMINEWRPLDPARDPLNVVVMALLLVAMLLRRRQLGALRLVLIGGLMVMAVLHVRHQSVLVLVAGLLLLEAQRDHQPVAARWQPAALAALALFMAGALVRLVVPLPRPDADGHPASAIAAVPAPLRALPVFNFYDFGGLLILNGIRPYVDGRSDMYGDAHMLEYGRVIDGDAQAFRQLVARGHVGWLLLRPDNRLLPVAERLGWRRLHADRFAVVLVRPDLPFRPAAAPAPAPATAAPRTVPAAGAA